MNIFTWLPYLIKIANHQEEIEQLQELLGPTIAEFNKVKEKVLPLLGKLYSGVMH